MNRSYYSRSLKEFLEEDPSKILGILAESHRYDIEEEQKNAWVEQIQILKDGLHDFSSGHIIFEYTIPRMGKRVDVIFIYAGLVFVIEFKVHEKNYPQIAVDQCCDYALDLKYFQKESAGRYLVPLLISTDAPVHKNDIREPRDKVFDVLFANKHNFVTIITKLANEYRESDIDAKLWEESSYEPTPTIIEAARALYAGHNVRDISRSGASAKNLEDTTTAINNIIEQSKKDGTKSICFLTGVPGAGKTLAGLNIATSHGEETKTDHAVFLSGNGPLVKVLQEALTRDHIERNPKVKKKDARRTTSAFIQNIHHFRDDSIADKSAPSERIVIFDEAQRAWDEAATANFMKLKKGIPNFNRSEPDFLISVMDRHDGWAVILCLVGGGQEINRGEAGIIEWFDSIKHGYPEWQVYVSNKIIDNEYTRGLDLYNLFEGMNVTPKIDLHLHVPQRSFRSEHVSAFVKDLLDCKIKDANENLKEIGEKYPIVMTRSLFSAKRWLRDKARGSERYGITSSAKAHRLRPYGIYAGYDVDPPRWFLNTKDDLRSSYYLECVATEFDIQGLELDWVCVAWDSNFGHVGPGWKYREFRGKKWTNINNDNRKMYLKNAYRVLLTRARQGMIVFIPKGDSTDPTRNPKYYDGTYKYLQEIGIQEI